MNLKEWLKPIRLDFEQEVTDRRALGRSLNRQIREALIASGLAVEAFDRAVYVIRMTGSFVVAYQRGSSPVLYIGRGKVETRVIAHLRRWLAEVKNFGSDTGVEIRIIVPRRKKREDYYKNVEADLIEYFFERYGQIPMVNSRRETKYVLDDHSPDMTKRLRQMVGTGKGHRPKWALTPLPSNKLHDVYYKG